jgi:hypothetical protein
MNRPAEFLTHPKFFDISEGRETQRLLLAGELSAYSAVLDAVITVPAGFEFEESVPRAALGLAPQEGSSKRAACLHDFLYFHGGYNLGMGFVGGLIPCHVPVTRAQADAVYHEFLLVKGCPRASAHMRWLGVRLGGWKAWNQHRKLRP